MISMLMMVSAVLTFPLWVRLINPDFFSNVRCIGQLPDGSVVKAAGSACTDSDRFITVMMLTQQDNGTIEITGDTSILNPLGVADIEDPGHSTERRE